MVTLNGSELEALKTERSEREKKRVVDAHRADAPYISEMVAKNIYPQNCQDLCEVKFGAAVGGHSAGVVSSFTK